MSNVTNRLGGEAPKRGIELIISTALAVVAVAAAAVIAPQVLASDSTATAEAEVTTIVADDLGTFIDQQERVDKRAEDALFSFI
jgi:hypothetical protein